MSAAPRVAVVGATGAVGRIMLEVLVGRRTLGEGRGHNKKEAEQAAARDALENVKRLRDLGAEDFLEKPFDGPALTRKVRKLIGEP